MTPFHNFIFAMAYPVVEIEGKKSDPTRHNFEHPPPLENLYVVQRRCEALGPFCPLGEGQEPESAGCKREVEEDWGRKR